jgi:hypothetical protein
MTPPTHARLLSGDLVRVKPWAEIQATLDAAGMIDGLPFMQEMASYCGQTFKVWRRLERTCDEAGGTIRRIESVVFLDDLRCDGAAHGGCQRGCRFFWKEAWLAGISEGQGAVETTREAVESFPFPQSTAEGTYTCQATALIGATSELPGHDFGSYARDIRARTYTVGQLLKGVRHALYLRTRHVLTGKSAVVLEGDLTKTPSETLHLEAGDWVEVKSADEISKTLDREGRNRGMAFTVEMLPFCGRRFRVLRRLERIIPDAGERMIELQNTVMLEGVTCDGCHSLRGGCPRDQYHFWREIWLRRVQPPVEASREPK